MSVCSWVSQEGAFIWRLGCYTNEVDVVSVCCEAVLLIHC